MGIVLLISLPIVALLVLIGVMRNRRFRRRREGENRRCKCGYIIENLTTPRCPECGRAIGFDASFEELGITPEELAEAAKRKELRGKISPNKS